MENKSQQKKETVSLNQALDDIEKAKNSQKNKKLSYKTVLEIFNNYQQQSGIKPNDLIDILDKGCNTFPKDEIKILLNVFIETKSKNVSSLTVLNYILDKCVIRLKKIGCNVIDFDLYKPDDITEDLIRFINKAKKKNISLTDKKEKDNDFVSVLYLYLAISIENLQKNRFERNKMLINMERCFVECFLLQPEKSSERKLCSCIPKSLLSNKYQSSFESFYYLYSEFKIQSNDLTETIENQREYINILNKKLTQQHEINDDLSEKLATLNEQLSEEHLKAVEMENGKKEAEDRLVFETNRIEMQHNAKIKGISSKYNKTLGLEVEGIEDILEYISDPKAKSAIQERVDRIKNILRGN